MWDVGCFNIRLQSPIVQGDDMTPHDQTIPYGFCHCGCGGRTTVANKTSTRDGTVKGRPNLYLSHHHQWAGPRYAEEDRGYKTPCWIWQGGLNSGGYGPHVKFWKQKNGPIPKGLEPDHLCRVRPCINPDHMELVTRRENVLRGLAPDVTKKRHAAVTHCPKGHEYTPENTRYSMRKDRSCHNRICRTCSRDSMRARRAKTA
jgi:hypothetical protein